MLVSWTSTATHTQQQQCWRRRCSNICSIISLVHCSTGWIRWNALQYCNAALPPSALIHTVLCHHLLWVECFLVSLLHCVQKVRVDYISLYCSSYVVNTVTRIGFTMPIDTQAFNPIHTGRTKHTLSTFQEEHTELYACLDSFTLAKGHKTFRRFSSFSSFSFTDEQGRM